MNELWKRDHFVLVVSIDRKSRTVRPDAAEVCRSLVQGLPREYFDLDVDDWSVDDIKPATVKIDV